MDDMATTRRFLTEPPPEPHVVAEGRARLLAATVGRDRTVAVTSPAPRARRRALRRPLRLGLSGVVAATVVAVAALVPPVDTAPGAGDPPVADGSTRGVLLAAAVSAESAPTAGAYWHVRSTSTTTWPRELGSGDNRYTVELHSVVEEWTNRDGRTWWGQRSWVAPESAEDDASWRRDGSPDEWCTGHTDTQPAQPRCLRTAPGTSSLMQVGEDSFMVAEGSELTFAQLQRLPDDPEALRKWVTDAATDDLDPSVSAEILELNVAEVLANLLVDVPVPPEVRAAAYRALADMPNVRTTGPTTDELGRAGVGILIDVAGEAIAAGAPGGEPFAGKLTHELIIDPQTSYVLASHMNLATRSEPVGRTLILDVGWADEEPHEPEMP